MWPDYMLRLWHGKADSRREMLRPAAILRLLLLPRDRGVQVDHQLVAWDLHTFCLPQPLVGQSARQLVTA
jgi:hypothetical protein